MNERRIYRGSHGEYYWLTSTEDYSGTLLRLCPEIVIGRYVAVTSVDSGVLRLREEELARGWRIHGGVGYSPIIRASEEVPHQYDGPDAPGYDEFYVFVCPCELGERIQGNIFLEQFAPTPGRVAAFVSWADFVLHDPTPAVESLITLFWPQLERLQPESYVADGAKCLTFASRRKELVERLYELLAAQL